MVKEALSDHAMAPVRSWLVTTPAACLVGRERSPTGDALVVDLGADLDASTLDRLRQALVDGQVPPRRPVFVRLAGLAEGNADAALDASLHVAPDGIVLADCVGAADVQRLGARLAVREAERGIPDGATRIVAVASSSAGLLALGGLREASSRLLGIGWDARALAAELAPGRPAPPAGLAHARAVTLVAARAAGALAIDALSDAEPGAFAAACAASWRDGFDGMFAANAAQAATIDAAFGG